MDVERLNFLYFNPLNLVVLSVGLSNFCRKSFMTENEKLGDWSTKGSDKNKISGAKMKKGEM